MRAVVPILGVIATFFLSPSASASFWDRVILEGSGMFRVIDGVGERQGHNFSITKPTLDNPLVVESPTLKVYFPRADPYGYNLDSKTFWGLGLTMGYHVSNRVAILLSIYSYNIRNSELMQPWATDPNGAYANVSGVTTQRGKYSQGELDLAVEYDLAWNGLFVTGGRRILVYEYEISLSNTWIQGSNQVEDEVYTDRAACSDVMTMFGLGISRPFTRFGNVVTVVSYSFPTVSKGLQVRTGFRLKL